MPPLSDAISPWHDFYIMLGTASATLIGLLFVAASVGSGVFTLERPHAMRVFLSPSVVHFTSVLTTCLIAISPIRGRAPLILLLGIVALFGLGYCLYVWRNMIRSGLSASLDLADRTCYAALPAVGYLCLIAAAIMLESRTDMGCALLPLATCGLLLIGIRNAWDITSWTVMKSGR
jgi:hypothetical protein